MFLSILVVTSFTLFALPTVGFADDRFEVIDERFVYDTSTFGFKGNDYTGISINGLVQNSTDVPSWLLCSDSSGKASSSYVKNADDLKCSNSTKYKFRSILPVCGLAADKNCLLSLYSENPHERLEANFGRYSTESKQHIFQGYSGTLVPDGSLPSLWKFDATNEELSGNFLVTLTLSGEYFVAGNKVENLKLSAEIFRVTPVVDIGLAEPKLDRVEQDVIFRWGGSFGKLPYNVTTSCVITVENICYMKEKLPTQVQLGLKFKTDLDLGGWFHGRIRDGNVNVTSTGPGSIYELSGTASKIPLILAHSRISESPYDSRFGVSVPDPDSPYALKALEAWLPVINDRAQAVPTMWTVKSMGSSDPCMVSTNQILGFVSTNSATYSSGPPTWDETSRELVYKLVSPHFQPDNTIFKGSYNLQIRPDVARCLYGFKSAPIMATIQVGYSNGVGSIVTTTVSQSKDWIRLSANNFEFSSPIIRLKFRESKLGVMETLTPPKAQIKSKTTIICLKNEKKVSITALTPRCPKGYKKK